MNDSESPLSITPETSLFAIIEAYPDLDGLLMELVPAYGRFKTPVLRRVVTQILTLEQAAQASNISLPDLVRKLRKAAGLAEETPSETGNAMSGAPSWVKSGKIEKTLDARPMLAQGQHPKALVAQELSALSPGGIFMLITPFVPGPLIELGRAEGFQTWTHQGESGRFETYFGKP